MPVEQKSKDDKPTQLGSNRAWIDTIKEYDRYYAAWVKRANRIVQRYKDADRKNASDNGVARINILWSNVQTLIPAVFSRLPKPDVSRRYSDNDQVGRVASLLLERALEFEIEHYPDYRSAMRNSVLDRFLPGRGVAWVRYEPHFKAAQSDDSSNDLPDGVQVTEDADESEEQDESQEEIHY